MTESAPFARATHAYRDAPPRQVPGFASLHRMTAMLLDEKVPADARILVLGAGGGLELEALARFQPGWTFDGIDPSANMLAIAREATAPYAKRVRLHEGYIQHAPDVQFDGAVSLLTFHFIPLQERLETLRQIRQRLKPGAPFVLAHISFPQTEPERSQWIARHVAFGGTAPENAEAARQAIGTRLHVLSPDDEVAALHQAGFSGTTLFYAGLSFRGWVSYAA